MVSDPGTTGRYKWVGDIDPKFTNYDKSEIGSPVSVGSYQPNNWGFHDMHGNVWEWTIDADRIYSEELVTDPIGLVSGTTRGIMGGSFKVPWNYLQAGTRIDLDTTAVSNNLGFRLCLAPAR